MGDILKNKNCIFILCMVFQSLLNAQELKEVSIQLLWKHQFEFAGFYMAKEKGFYKDVGIDVSLKEYEFGTNISKDVSEGKSDFGVDGSSLILDKINNLDIYLLMPFLQISPFVIMTKQRDDINAYSVQLLSTMHRYINTKSIYLKERILIDSDIRKGLKIKADRSAYVYSLKNKCLEYKIELNSLNDNSVIEVPDILFPGLSDKIRETRGNLEISENILTNIKASKCKQDCIDDFVNQSEVEINKLQNEFILVAEELTIELIRLSKMRFIKSRKIN